MQTENLHFQVSPSSGEPIYRQLIEQINRMLASGHLKSGDFLPSVRQLAAQLEVNPMTISKAYSLLETQGQVERVRGRGMMIVETSKKSSLQERLALLEPLLATLIQQCQQLDISEQQAVEWIAENINKEQS